MPINMVFPHDAMLSVVHAVVCPSVCLQIMLHEKLGTLVILKCDVKLQNFY